MIDGAEMLMSAARRRALHHRSSVQPHEPAFWVFAAFLVYGAVRIDRHARRLSSVSRSGWALSWLLLRALRGARCSC